MYKLSWYRTDLVVLIELVGAIDIEELTHINKEIVSIYLDPAQSIIHLLTDCTQVTKFPMNLSDAIAASENVGRHPQHGIDIYVGLLNPEQSFLGKIVPSLFELSFFAVNTLEDANKILKERGIIA